MLRVQKYRKRIWIRLKWLTVLWFKYQVFYFGFNGLLFDLCNVSYYTLKDTRITSTSISASTYAFNLSLLTLNIKNHHLIK